MKDVERRDHESAIEAVARAVIQEAEPELRAVGVRVRRLAVTHHPNEDPVHTAELEIVFDKEGDFFDIFEFFIWRDGAPALSVEEARQGLRSDVAEVIENARTGNSP